MIREKQAQNKGEVAKSQSKKIEIQHNEFLIENPEDINMQTQTDDRIDKLQKFAKLKQYASNFVKAGNFQLARAKYQQAIDYVPFAEEVCPLYCNMALCSLKMDKYEQAFEDLKDCFQKAEGVDL